MVQTPLLMQKKLINQIIKADCIEGMKALADNSIDCVVTSPPYYALRDYEVPGQIGMEETPEAFIAKLVLVFEQVRRVLKEDGTIWVNMGDTYWAGKGKSGQSYSKQYQNERYNGGRSFNGSQHQVAGKGVTRPNDGKSEIYKPKDLIGIPWMLAFALRSSGWYLRQDIIWHKPNPMHESVTDRCSKAHEYLFMLSKSSKYYFDSLSIKQPVKISTTQRLSQDVENQKGSERAVGKTNGRMKAVSGNKERKPGSARGCPEGSGSNVSSHVPWEGYLANKRSVWTVATKPFKEAHFATFPPELIIDCIKAGCSPGGIVMDPFMGAGTTALVSQKLGRNYIGFELNQKYIDIAEKRLKKELGFMYQLQY